MLNHQNDEGNTPLHHGFLHQTSIEIVEYLVQEGCDLTIRNNMGQSCFHLAAKYYEPEPLLLVIDLLIKHGASVNEIDNLGSSVLHEAFKNSSLKQEVIEKLLNMGAYLDHRDHDGNPPLAYCAKSTLQWNEKKSIEETLIKYSVLEKMSSIQRNNLPLIDFGDSVICFHFCKDETKRNEWISYRDNCISEIIDFEEICLDLNCSLLQLLTDYSDNVDKYLNLSNFKTILYNIHYYEFPIYRDMINSVLEKYEFENIIEDFSLELVSISPSGNVKLSSDCLVKVLKFLSKKEKIDFILAFHEF